MCPYHLSDPRLQSWGPNADLGSASRGPRAVCPEASGVRKSETQLVALSRVRPMEVQVRVSGGPARGRRATSVNVGGGEGSTGSPRLLQPLLGLPALWPSGVGVAKLLAPREAREGPGSESPETRSPALPGQVNCRIHYMEWR